MKTFSNKKIVIIGLGLIGGSIAKALKFANICQHVWAYDLDIDVLVSAKKQRIIYDYGNDLKETCLNADIIIIAVPGLTVRSILESIQGFVTDDQIITDVASVKCSTVDAAVSVFGEVPVNMVPGHPIAGSEKSGFSAAIKDLFQGKKVLLTPLDHTSTLAIETVSDLWKSIGAEVLQMTVEHHDEVLAATSHLPHLLAFSLVDTLSQQGKSEEIFRYAAGGFRDFTRIASSDPQMWKDIFLANGHATLAILDKFSSDLEILREGVREGDANLLMTIFSRAKHSRDKFMSFSNKNANQEEHGLVFSVQPGGQLSGECRVPGDKSISHRSIILGAIAEGKTTVDGFLEGEDSLATLNVFKQLGIKIEGPVKGSLSIEGKGLYGLQASDQPLYLGNSGTSMRLLTGLMAAQKFSSSLSGDESLSKRPMHRVTKPLQSMGANIRLEEGGLAPIEIAPGNLQAIDYHMPVASAQVKSCLLLASLYVSGTSRIVEPAPCRDHTERMLKGFGYEVATSANTIELTGGGTLKACHIDIPADISSAAFFMVGACISPGADICLQHVGINPTRVGVINILREMGAKIEYLREYEAGGEPVADIRVQYSALHGINIPVEQVPLAIDEFPAIFIAAACAKGVTVLSGAEELRVKESDRIQAMADGLAILGVSHQVKDDGMEIIGNTSDDVFTGGTIDSKGDHRIAMSFAIAALRASAEINILDCNNVSTSFPNFLQLAKQAGLNITLANGPTLNKS